MASIIDGKKISQDIADELKKEFSKIKKKVQLAIVMVGEDEATKSFVSQKQKFAESIGVKTKIYSLSKDINTRKLRQKIVEISKITQNGGVIVQLPLPKNIDETRVLNAISKYKDVDALTEKNLGKFLINRLKILPPPVLALKYIFESHKIDVGGKNVAVIGYGKLIGRPISVYLLNQLATVSVLNENTKNISEFSKNADIIISGVGKPNLIKKDMIKDGAVVIDFGFSKINGKIVGDVDFQSVKEKASLITPVPGGMGPIVVAMVFKNLLDLLRN